MINVTTVINGWNLIGDTVYMIRPVEAYLRANPQTSIAIAVARNLGGELVRWHFAGRVPVIYAEENQPMSELCEYEQEIRIDVGKAFASGKHIAGAYSDHLGVPWDGDRSIPFSFDDIVPDEMYTGAVLFAPYSVSGTTNKMIFEHELAPMVSAASRFTCYILVGKDPNPRAGELKASNIYDFACIASAARLIVCCDNGISHLASALGVKTVVFWKNCVAESWIAPTWGRQTKLCYNVTEVCREIANA